MLPKIHIIIGAILSLLIFFIFKISFFHASVIFLSSFLIDFDHYLYYLFTKRDLSLKNAHKWFLEKRKRLLSLEKNKRKNFKLPIFIFHGIEFWIILFLFSFINKTSLWILIGIAIHMLLDFMEIIYLEMPLYSKISQIYTLRKNKNKSYFN